MAGGTAKEIEHVRATVFETHVVSSKHVSPLATVRWAVCHHWSGSHFSDGRGWVSRPLHTAEATARVVPLPREKRYFWCPARQCPRQNRTGRVQAYLSDTTDGGQATLWQAAGIHTQQHATAGAPHQDKVCDDGGQATQRRVVDWRAADARQYPGWSTHSPPAHALLCAMCIFHEHNLKHCRRRKRPTSKKPLVCDYVFLATARNAPICACPSSGHVQPAVIGGCYCSMCGNTLTIPHGPSLSLLSNLHSLPPSQAHAHGEG